MQRLEFDIFHPAHTRCMCNRLGTESHEVEEGVRKHEEIGVISQNNGLCEWRLWGHMTAVPLFLALCGFTIPSW